MKARNYGDWRSRAETVLQMRLAGWKYWEIARNLKISDTCARNDISLLTGMKISLPFQHKEGVQPRTCQKCNGYMRVIDTRTTKTYLRRRRKCQDCGNRITTHEIVVDAPVEAGAGRDR